MHIEWRRLKEIPLGEIGHLLNHPRVRHYMPLASTAMDIDATAEWVRGKEAQWRQYGYGPWAIVIDGRFAGWGGFQHEAGDADLALVLLPAYWGQGHVLLRILINKAWQLLALPSVTLHLPPVRQRIRGIFRLGFVPDGQVDFDGEIFRRYRLLAPGLVNPSHPASFRPACKADIPALYTVRMAMQENRVHRPDLIPYDQVRHAVCLGGSFVATIDEQVVGFSMATRPPDQIWALFVLPACQQRGLGKTLLRMATDWLRRQGGRQVMLSTTPGTRAEQFYRRQGWQGSEIDEEGQLTLFLDLVPVK